MVIRKVKIKFYKRRSDFNENIIPHRVQYLCPSCHGEFKQKFKNIECKSCGKIFPFISKDIPDFILYELILPGKCLNASTHIFEEKLEPKIHLFKIGDIVIRSIYSFLILYAAFLLVLFRVITQRPKIEKILNIEGRLKEYLKIYKRNKIK